MNAVLSKFNPNARGTMAMHNAEKDRYLHIISK
jgi:hypothetical protein